MGLHILMAPWHPDLWSKGHTACAAHLTVFFSIHLLAVGQFMGPEENGRE